MRHHHQLVRLWLLSLLCLMLCSACTLPFRVFENTHYPSPPQYPQAQHWEVQKVQSRYDDSLRIIHFQTQDDVETVYQFFNTTLPEQGWVESSPRSTGHDYHYSLPNPSLPPHNHLFVLNVTAERQADITNVTIQFLYAGPGVLFPDDYVFSPGYDPSPIPSPVSTVTPTA